jgi:tetratricopeptide (TPR) repeat protein
MSDRLAQLEKLALADPGDADVPYMIAQERAKLGDRAGAIAAFDLCLKLDPDYHYAGYHKAKVLMTMERNDEAIAVLREALKRAKAAQDAKASSELAALLDELT